MQDARQAVFAHGEAGRQHVRLHLSSPDGAEDGEIPRDHHLRPGMARRGPRAAYDRGEGQKFPLFQMLGNIVFELHTNRLVVIAFRRAMLRRGLIHVFAGIILHAPSWRSKAAHPWRPKERGRVAPSFRSFAALCRVVFIAEASCAWQN